jgi:uncharacterized protein (TIGR00369 family)
MTAPNQWLTESPFLVDLGVRWHDGKIIMDVAEPHSASGALHGGAIAALAMVSAQATMRAPDPGVDPSTTSLHVTYARAGRGTVFTASSSTVRRTRELGFYQTDIRSESGEVIAAASSTLSEDRRGGAVLEPMPPLAGDPVEFTKAAEAAPFLSRRGLRFEGVDRGAVEVAMAPAERNLDGKGRIHEGALLTLIDVAGSSVPWTCSGAANGATIALNAQILGELPEGAMVARATLRAHDERVFWCGVDVFTETDHRLCALGTLTYRFG